MRSLKSTQPWADVLVEAMDKDKQETYLHRKAAVDFYISGEPVYEIYKITGIASKELHRLLGRCMIFSRDGLVYGYRALIPRLSLSGYNRVSKLGSQLPESKAGYAGILMQTFSRYPELKTHLDNIILKKKSKALFTNMRLNLKHYTSALRIF